MRCRQRSYDAKWLTWLEAVESAIARGGHDPVARRMDV